MTQLSELVAPGGKSSEVSLEARGDVEISTEL